MAERAERQGQVEHIIQVRASRRSFFPDWIFGGEAAWDMLLELYRARLNGRTVSIAELPGAVILPPSTAVRWMSALENAGLVVRPADPAGAEMMALSDQGLCAIDSFLETLPIQTHG